MIGIEPLALGSIVGVALIAMERAAGAKQSPLW